MANDAPTTDLDFDSPELIDPASLIPTKSWPLQSAAAVAGITSRDLNFVPLSTVLEKGLVPGLESYNWLLEHGLRQIFREQFRIRKRYPNLRKSDPNTVSVDLELDFTEVEVGFPVRTSDLKTAGPKLPAHARVERGPAGNLAAPLRLKVEAKLIATSRTGATREVAASLGLTSVGEIPILVRSVRCHTNLMTPEVLRLSDEDPADAGGYAIIRGIEYSVEQTENIVYNSILVYPRPTQGVEAKVQFISQAGGAFDNSSQVEVHHLTNGGLTLNLSTQSQLMTQDLPFYLVFRLLGATTDRELVSSVVFGVLEANEDPVTQQMHDWLDAAYTAPYKGGLDELASVTNHDELVLAAAARLIPGETEADPAYLYHQLMDTFDGQFLPHVGTGPEDRPAKIRFLGLMVRRLFLMELGGIPPTDRDSYEQKRIHDAGVTVAKSLKRAINEGVIAPFYTSLRHLLASQPFEAIKPSLLSDTIRGALGKSKLSHHLAQAITSGYRSGGRRGTSRPSRLKSQALERKNALNTAATLRTIHTQSSSDSKHTKRGMDRRQVHPSYAGYICPIRSADTGEAVGMTKEQTIATRVSRESDPAPLRAALRADPAVVPFEKSGYAAYAGKDEPLTIVLVGGNWVGGTADPAALVARYRRLRREGRVVPSTVTVTWSAAASTVSFFVDAGRLLRPLLIVDNNQAEFDAAARAGEPIPFVQAPSAGPDDIAALRTGAARMADLVAAGHVEWIAPEEQANALIAIDIDTLRAARHDVLLPYTHVDVPLGLLSLTAHANIYTANSQPARGMYSTNQVRQATGAFVANPHGARVDNGRFYMNAVQTPLVSGLAHRFVSPAGKNIPVGYHCFAGKGQEDSAIVNRAAVQRGLFAGQYFGVVRAEQTKGEQYGRPPPDLLARGRPGVNYGTLQADGFPAAGTVLEPGDAAIGLVGENTGPDRATRPFVDRSKIYTRDESARVVRSYPATGTMKYEIHRPLGIGDKVSSRSGNKAIVSDLALPADLPSTADGYCSTMIINLQSFPTRMILGQIMEAAASTAGARNGILADGTVWSGETIGAISRRALGAGLSVKVGRQLYDGALGLPLDQQTHMGLTHIQRLLKFAHDERYAAPASGPRDPMTAQPIPGKSGGGANRMGEMEGHVLMAQGNLAIMREKFYTHSDGLEVPICRRCGLIAVDSPGERYVTCLACEDAADPIRLASRRTATVLTHELAGIVDYRVHPAPRTYLGAGGPAAPPPATAVSLDWSRVD